MYRIFLFACITCMFSSCAFNNKFHHPEKIPIALEKIPSYDFGKDTTYIAYNTESQEIILSKSEDDTINKNYTIRNEFFESTSGNRLNGWMLTPRDQEPIATILHFHGSGQNILTQYEAIAPLITYGFQVFTFDYSGYGFSEGTATRKNALQDAYAALDFAHKKAQTLIIYGQSYGGYLASIVGSNRQDKIEGMVIEGAFSSHKNEAKYEVPFWGNLVKNEQIADKEIQKNHKPVLIIHSVEDKKVPLEFGEKIFNHANMPKELYKIGNAHILGLQHYPQEIAEKIKEMIRVE